MTTPLVDRLLDAGDADELLVEFAAWAEERGTPLYPAQEEAVLELYAGSHVILNTPTGSGKSLVALAGHFASLAGRRRSFYTAPIKALVSEKFFELCATLGTANVGMMTGDASVNPGAPIICCTAEILANIALRHGADAPVDQVVMDEFHFYAEPDRGWAWQVPLLQLPRAQFLLMSATLGDVSFFRDDLASRTGRPVAVVTGTTRPVPLEYAYRRTPMHETVEEILATGRAPVYIVHFTQAAAVERAQALTSVNVCSRDEKAALADAIGRFRFAPGFGRQLARYLRAGIGVHHAGMLPRYRRLVERLAQEGHLKVICGTDTLGVGINVPIRTVLFTQLFKYDGSSARLLRAREFHQIAGRAGRAGFDTEGTVWVQAPEHDVENERALAKAGDDPRLRRKVVRRKPPVRGFVNWSEDTFRRLVAAPPEPLRSSFAVSHAMLLNVLSRRPGDGGDGCAGMKHLLTRNHEPHSAQRRHIRRAIAMFRSLERAGVVERLAEPDLSGRRVRVTVELQEDFALDQPLSPFVLEAVRHLDRDAETYALDVVSVVESVLEDPKPVLLAQLDKLRGETLARLKSEGVEYEARIEELDRLEHPKPLGDMLYELFDRYRTVHPWVEDHNIRPKSVVRDMYERALGFGDFVALYGVSRAEGLVLRYLSDAYKALVRTVPEDLKSEELYDLTEWLGELVRQVDSSLLDEWERLHAPEEVVAAAQAAAVTAEEPRPLSANPRALRVMVRNELFRRVELLARGRVDDVCTPGGCAPEDLRAGLGRYLAEHGEMLTGAPARAAGLFQVEEVPGRWAVRQVLDDPAGDHDWVLHAEVDLDASDQAGEPVVTVTGLDRWD